MTSHGDEKYFTISGNCQDVQIERNGVRHARVDQGASCR
jgi:hypothetical protein